MTGHPKQSGLLGFLGKLVLFAAWIAVWQVALTLLIPAPPSEGNLLRLDTYIREDVDVVYFGDSILLHHGPEETRKDGVDTLLRYYLKEKLTLGRLSQGAYHAEIYCAFLKHMVARGYRPRIVIQGINLASLITPKHPSHYYAEERNAMRAEENFWFRCFDHPLLVFHYPPLSPPITEEDYHNAVVYDGNEALGRIKDFLFDDPPGEPVPLSRVRDAVAVRCFGPMLPSKLEALVEFARICKQEGIRPIFYWTPLDYEAHEALHPDKFYQRIEASKAIVNRLLGDIGYVPEDWSYELRSEYFAYEDYPNEHLGFEGRKWLAVQLARKIWDTVEAAD